MATKTDIKKILSKGGLTGKEAGKLILQDNWQADHEGEGFLSDREIQTIRSSMKSTKDIEDFNSYINTYRFIDYTLKDAHIKALELHTRIDALIQLMLMYFFDAHSELELHTKPVIMTEKQYLDNKASARVNGLQELTDLHTILDDRARALASREIKDLEPEDSYSFFDWTREAYPEIWKQALIDILELLKSSKLKPVLFSGEGKERLDITWNRIRELQAQLPINTLPKEELIEKMVSGEALDDKVSKELKELNKQDEELIQSLYRTGKKRHNKKSQEELIASLEKLLEGSLSEAEEEATLYYAYCSGEELYQTGLPEWIKWIDNYSSPAIDDYGSGVAILADPKPDQVDKRGYYKPFRSPDMLLTKDGKELLSAFQIGADKLKEEAKIVLSFLVVTEAVSEVIGIDFAEDIRLWIKDMETIVGSYNTLRNRALLLDNIPEEIKTAIQPVNLNKLRPYAKTVKYLQERMALSLGDGWWEDVKQALYKDLKEKEASDGQEA